MRIWLGTAVALLSTSALNWGYFAQHQAAADAPAIELAHPLRSARSLLGSGAWLVSNGIVFVGWLLYLGALELAPISIVQAVSAGGIGLLAILAARRAPLTSRERASVLVALAGLALLAASLGTTNAAEHPGRVGTIVVWLVASAVVAVLAAGPFARALSGGAGLGIAAGIGFASADVASKAVLVAHRWWLVPVMLALYGGGFVALQLGFQRGSALTTAGLASVCMNALPIVGGLVVFHDALPHGARAAMRIAAFAAVVLGAALLARPDASEASPSDPAHHTRNR